MDRRVAGVVDDAEFDDLAFEKPQRPARATVRGLRAGQSDEFGFLHAVEDLLDRRRRALLAAQSGLQALFDQLLARPVNRRLIGVQRLDDLPVAEPRPGRGNIRQKQDTGLRQRLGPMLPLLDHRLQARPLLGHQIHDITLRNRKLRSHSSLPRESPRQGSQNSCQIAGSEPLAACRT